jgi:ferredoxin-NADP reductase
VFTEMETRGMHDRPTLWTTPWLRPLNDVAAIDDLLAQIHPTWSLGRIKARVLAVVDETADVKTFVLRPNRNWPGHRAGQHVGVEVEIDGVRHQRRYSLSSAPSDRRIAITVKRQPGGTVSSWLHARIRAGDALALDPPAGTFTLPTPRPARLLMLSAGSGITPLMAMLRDAADGAAPFDGVFVHVARRPADAIFAPELARLAATRRGLTVHAHHSSTHGRFDVASLAALVPDYADRPTLLCGPAGFMATVREHYVERGIDARLHQESFGAACAADSARTADFRAVRCARSERTFDAAPDVPLLVAAERAGLRPRYGCRMGICHTCTCVKRDGAVENLLTGAISSAPGERIQLCVSRARSDLTLEL